MRWLIDGYNVIRRDPDLRSAEARGLEAGRQALLQLVRALARQSADRYTVVFDGAAPQRPGGAEGQVQVVFSRPPRTADDELIDLARRLRAGTGVVSSDRAIRDAARRAGCAVLSAEQFVARATGRAGEGDEDPEDAEDTGDEAGRGRKRGNAWRRSRRDRATAQALRRLHRR